MLEVDAITTDIEDLCKQLGVAHLDVFGSATTDHFAPDSDVDVLVMSIGYFGILFGLFLIYVEVSDAFL